ncbi:MAG: methanogenesis marker 15 protein, partial [Thermoplasmata archaeon]|nr:methanogenesis marker 15 protein [Thermoplasmata archaeon]NIS11275.1 methanogenesis marker 15 protein [Thermoplasmata archaeon]NIS19215.1 methanogenesis marker 15 protein [Thermoplasmata archaeon]NIT76276.1 methanogenesis marker 15 protein [Thermoplasmata archaeon]NIU48350.1 methanogenesis marker 15 protein [Thermoplasmata archaeon]
MSKEDPVVAGLDLGSTYTKAAILAGDRVTGTSITPTIVDLDAAADTALDGALAAAGIGGDDLDMVVSTGYGRRGMGVAAH